MESEHPEHEYVDTSPIVDVRVYPQLFKTRRVDDEGHDEYIATDVRLHLGARPVIKNRKGKYVGHPELTTITVQNQELEELIEIRMHAKDQIDMMKTLVFWYAGLAGVDVLEKQMEKESYNIPADSDDDDEDPSRQPGDD